MSETQKEKAAAMPSSDRETSAAENAFMADMEARCDAWAEEVDLVSMIKAIAHVARLSPSASTKDRERFIAAMEAQIDALCRQSFLEGWVLAALPAEGCDSTAAAQSSRTPTHG